MKKEILSILSLSILLLTSCQKEDSLAINAGDGEVTFTAGVATRVSGSTWIKDDAIGVFMTPNDSDVNSDKTNVQYTVLSSAETPVFTSSAPFTFPVGAVDFLAYYPYKIGTTKTKYDIDVSDQTLLSADLMIATKTGAVQSDGAVALQFSHKLSNIVINISHGGGMEESDLAELKVELIGVMAVKADYNLSTNKITLEASNTQTSIILKTTTDGLKSEGVVIPQHISGGSLQLKLTTKTKGSFSTMIRVSEFKAGEEYTYKAVVNKENLITVSASAAGQTLSIDLGRTINPSEISWGGGPSVTSVTHKGGTIYDFEVPANAPTVAWNKTTIGTNNVTLATNGENDPDAIPTFGEPAAARTFIGTVGIVKITINQAAAAAVRYEYYGRYGSLLNDAEKQLEKNQGYTRKRAVITNEVSGTFSANNAIYHCQNSGHGWYLPAINQLAGAWVAVQSVFPFSHSATYWSSTSNSNQTMYLFSHLAFLSYSDIVTGRLVRCIKDL